MLEEIDFNVSYAPVTGIIYKTGSLEMTPGFTLFFHNFHYINGYPLRCIF